MAYPNENTTSFLKRKNAPALAYNYKSGKTGPGLVFIHGFMSDKEGTKATALESRARADGRPYLRFDLRGHGESEGNFPAATISDWTRDVLDMLTEKTEGPQILVGSSLGGWLMLLASLKAPERIAALVGLAPAPDFTEDLMWASFAPETRRRIMEDGLAEIPAGEDHTHLVSRPLIENGRKNLLLRAPIPLTCPVRILQGQADDSVPWERALTLAEKIKSRDVEIRLIKDGDHRLSRPEDLDKLFQTLDELYAPRRTP